MASRYERSLRNPLRRPLVGVPTHTAIKTKKVSYRATAVVDCASYASETKILWMPHAGCAEDVDVFRVVGGSISSGTNRTNSPFTASRFGDGLRARLVSARISVCGSSAVDNGVIVAGSSRVDDISDYNVADLVSRISEKHLVVARTVEDVVHMNYVPGSDDEREAFLDNVARGPYGGTRDITSEAYPARHVVAWQGESVDSEIITVPYTYNYPTKEVVYGDVDVPYSVTYNDPILYYPWGVIEGPLPGKPTYVDAPIDGFPDVQRKAVNGPDYSNGVSYQYNIYDVTFSFRNTVLERDVEFVLGRHDIEFTYGYTQEAPWYYTYNFLPKKITIIPRSIQDYLYDDVVWHIPAAEARDCWAGKQSLVRQLHLGPKLPCQSYTVRIDQWWDITSANYTVDGEQGSYFNSVNRVAYIGAINTFIDGTGVHVVDNPVTVTGTVTNNEVIEVNEGIATETISIPHEVVVGTQQLLIQVVTNWEFIGDPVDGSETVTPGAVVTIGDGVLSDVFTTPRNTNEKRTRFDDTAERHVSSRDRAAPKKLDSIPEDPWDSA